MNSHSEPRLQRGFRPPERRVHDRPEVDGPSEQEEPEKDREAELKNRHSETALHELAKSGNEEAANRGDDVSCGTLSGR